MSLLLDLLGDYTLQTVAIGAILLGITSGALGSFAVLREQGMLGDTLSHAALPGICLGFIVAGTRDLGSMLAGAMITGVLAALIMLVLTRKSRLKSDAGLGIVLGVSFAIGLVLLTHIQGTNNAAQGGLDSFLFGQAASILRSDLWVMGGITLFAVALVALFWKEFKLVTFDPAFAGALGMPVVLLETALTAMIVLAVVVGLQMVGVVLMASMVIAPAVAARQWVGRLGAMVVLAAVIGSSSGIIGAGLSVTRPGLATGPLIILAASAIVLLSLLFAPGRGLLWTGQQQLRNRRRLKRFRLLLSLYLASDDRPPGEAVAEHEIARPGRGESTAEALGRLQKQGLVRRHAEPAHGWVLTEAGRSRAQSLVGTPGVAGNAS